MHKPSLPEHSYPLVSSYRRRSPLEVVARNFDHKTQTEVTLNSIGTLFLFKKCFYYMVVIHGVSL
jgi:hypothetical protein